MDEIIINLKKGSHSDIPKNCIPVLKKVLYTAGYLGSFTVTVGPQVRAGNGTPKYSLSSQVVANSTTSVEIYIKTDDNGSRYLFYFFPPKNETIKNMYNNLRKAVDKLNGKTEGNLPNDAANHGEVRLELEDPEERQPYWYILWPHNGKECIINTWPGTNKLLYRDANSKMSEDPAYSQACKLLERMRYNWGRSLRGEITFKIDKYTLPDKHEKHACSKFGTSLGDILKQKIEEELKPKEETVMDKEFVGEVVPAKELPAAPIESKVLSTPSSTPVQETIPQVIASIRSRKRNGDKPCAITQKRNVSSITADRTLVNLIFDYIFEKADSQNRISRKDVKIILKNLNLEYPIQYIITNFIYRGYLHSLADEGEKGMLEVTYRLPKEKEKPLIDIMEHSEAIIPISIKELMEKMSGIIELVNTHEKMKGDLAEINKVIETKLDEIQALNLSKSKLQDEFDKNTPLYNSAINQIARIEDALKKKVKKV